ncbi:MAG: glycosyltransferase domain-containing protein [Leptolyngbyaceae cyanobacterium]
MITNLQFGTHPSVIHAQGHLAQIPHWQPIKDAFFSSPSQNIGPIEDLTILTWNNGHDNMGMLEQSLEHLGVPYQVVGQGVESWVNSTHKPLLTRDALATMTTTYVLGVDSRDAIVINNPQILLQQFQQKFEQMLNCELVFSGDRLNWPNLKPFQDFETSLPEANKSDFRFLNGGIWLGKVEFCREFFAAAVETPPMPEAPESEQGILKQLFPRYYPKVQLDYYCTMFQNIGFVFAPIFDIPEARVKTP